MFLVLFESDFDLVYLVFRWVLLVFLLLYSVVFGVLQWESCLFVLFVDVGLVLG